MESRVNQDVSARARIRQAAVELFARDGFEGTSLRDIAAVAGVAHGLVRHHFGDKAGLRAAADELVLDRLRVPFAVPVDQGLEAVVTHRRTELARLAAEWPAVFDYLGRSLVDEGGSRIFEEMAVGFEVYLDALEANGLLQPTDDRRARAALVMLVTLGPWAFRTGLARSFDIDLTDPDQIGRWIDVEQTLMQRGLLRPEPGNDDAAGGGRPPTGGGRTPPAGPAGRR